MSTRCWKRPRKGLRVGVLAMGLIWAGCTNGPRHAAAVDPEQARTALLTALDAWKLGQTPASLTTASPTITVQDMDWERGCKLRSFEMLTAERHDDSNLRIPVRLVIDEPGKPSSTKQVSYVVGTDPTITVFREWF